MHDGVPLAVDLRLADGLSPGARLPAILEQTRYYRSVLLKPEAGGGCKPRLGTTVGFMVPRGYAYVAGDAREAALLGTGMSASQHRLAAKGAGGLRQNHATRRETQ